MSIDTNFRTDINSTLRQMSTASANSGMRGLNNPLLNSSQGSDMLQAMVRSSVTFLTAGPGRADALRSTISSLTEVLTRRTAGSDNTDVLRIRSAGQNVEDTSVLIKQVATTQLNEGKIMERTAQVEVTGLHKFAIEVDGTKHEISFTVTENLTNQQFQQQMAAAINAANIGITASVSMENGGNGSRLNLESSETGAGKEDGPRFTIRDLTGNAVELTGITNIRRQGQDAVFIVNGGDRQTSASNDVDLGGGLNVTLVNASDDEVLISMQKNPSAVQHELRHFVNDLNRLIDVVRINNADRTTRMLLRDIETTIRVNRRALEEVGISMNAEGVLVINENRMRTAVENGTVERLFTNNGRLSNSFARRLDRTAESISRNPMRHVSPHVGRMPGFNATLTAVNNANARGRSGGTSPFDAYDHNDSVSMFFDGSR